MTDSNGVKRRDTLRGPPLRVLSLDGGGVRGYSMLIILQELMHKTFNETEGRAPKRHEIPKPCDYFDLIGGTGTGGLIAIMLGRLRLDLETCKEVYIRMTRKVFETDKTVFGMPYKSTLFKASKLEEAIRECVREHTIYMDEGNDGTDQGGREGGTPPGTSSGRDSKLDRRASISSSMSGGYNPRQVSWSMAMRYGNPNASLYDARENRTKTAVTAVYKDTSPRDGSSILLRSYDSRKEPPAEFKCTIWQAGRATSAIGLAFKPIQIGQSVFVDEGAGKYNPSPQLMDEAAVNEWPGREIGAFVSVGTGKRPASASSAANQHEWWESFIGGTAGDYAEARRRLVAKIEGCEETHQYMMGEHLGKRGVNPENYYRLNVEVGVGEFGMNEWSRVADISTSTRVYLARPEVKVQVEHAASKMARIERSKRRHSNFATTMPELSSVPSPPNPMVVELPAGDVPASHQYQNLAPHRMASPDAKFSVLSPHDIPPSAQHRRSGDSRRADDPRSSNSSIQASPRVSHESGRTNAAVPPYPHYPSSGNGPPQPPVQQKPVQPPRPTQTQQQGTYQQQQLPVRPFPEKTGPPPRPPKTPIPQSPGTTTPPNAANYLMSPVSPETPQSRLQRAHSTGAATPYVVSPVIPQDPRMSAHSVHTVAGGGGYYSGGVQQGGGGYAGRGQYVLPYPDDDGPPPAVNMAGKPRFVQR